MQVDRLEELLRETFDEARPVGKSNVVALRAGAARRAAALRRRRTALNVTGAAVATAALVAAGVLAPDLVGGQRGPDRLPAAATKAAGAQWTTHVRAEGVFAYDFPDVQPQPLPSGVVPLVVEQSSGSKVTPAAASLQDANLGGEVGFCRWSDPAMKGRRMPVAGTHWVYGAVGYPRDIHAGLGLVGFTTGTGADAFRDFAASALPCYPATGMTKHHWEGPGEESVLFAETSTVRAVTSSTALAVTRVGDVLVGGSAREPRAADARRIATELAAGAAQALVSRTFPPALGEPLGRSAVAPNSASAPGAHIVERSPAPARYSFGDVLPDTAELPGGLKSHGDPLESPNVAPALGAQVCDPTAVSESNPGQEKAPQPVAGLHQTLWTGDGGSGDATADLTLTGWATGTGRARFADLQSNHLFCIWFGRQERVTWPGQDPKTTWLSRGDGGGSPQFVAARLVGDVIVVAVVSEPSADSARAHAMSLSVTVADKLRASGLPAAEGK